MTMHVRRPPASITADSSGHKRRGVRFKILLIIAAVFLAVGALFWRPVFQWGAVYWVRHKAHRIFDQYSPEYRANLNALPVQIELPPVAERDSVESTPWGTYVIHYPTPVSISIKSAIRLHYPEGDVFVMRPFSLAEEDALARQLHYPDSFDMDLATFRLRPDDVDQQKDLKSMRSFLLDIAHKPNAAIEEFISDQKRGFIVTGPKSQGNSRINARIRFARTQTGCGLLFNPKEFTDAQVRRFVAEFEVTLGPSPATQK